MQLELNKELDIANNIVNKTSKNIKKALNKKDNFNEDDFLALISPQAVNYLDQMADIAHQKTRSYFGANMLLYTPVYLSNFCTNICTYCGYSALNKIKRKVLNSQEILSEISYLKKQGFEHVLLVTGDANKKIGIDYFLKALKLFKENFSYVALEVQSLTLEEYQKLKSAGLDAVLLYQETYNQKQYQEVHLKGSKSDYFYRLDAPKRIAKAKINKIGLGALLGLSKNWQSESVYLYRHLDYLEKKYWQNKFSLSFPRIRPYVGGQIDNKFIKDKELMQLIMAFRIVKPHLELSLSTRESATFRNLAMQIGITTMSAGSKTNPGGYSASKEELEQFAIEDKRTLAQMKQALKAQNIFPLLKDNEDCFS